METSFPKPLTIDEH